MKRLNLLILVCTIGLATSCKEQVCTCTYVITTNGVETNRVVTKNSKYTDSTDPSCESRSYTSSSTSGSNTDTESNTCSMQDK